MTKCSVKYRFHRNRKHESKQQQKRPDELKQNADRQINVYSVSGIE